MIGRVGKGLASPTRPIFKQLHTDYAEEQPADHSPDHGHGESPDQEVAEEFLLVLVFTCTGDAQSAQCGQWRCIDKVGADIDG